MGFPSPGDEYVDKKIDLQAYLVRHPAATFFVRMTGTSLVDSGIISGDLLVVDRSLKPKNSDIVVACAAGEFLVKKSPFEFSEDFVVWGVVTGVVRRL